MSAASISGAQSPQINSKSDMVEVLARGCKPKNEWRIGTEHEKFVFHKKDMSQVAYAGENGIRAVLEKVQSLTDWTPLMDAGNIIGLKEPGGGAISLEPGGQVELSGAPLETLHQTCSETHQHLKMFQDVVEPMGLGFLGLGVTPTWTLDDVSAMPKSRYGIMAPYMKKTGTLGTSMMFRSCTIQVNLDFSSEADMVQKMRMSLALQPIATALFANSPFLEGKPNGFQSFRSEIWRDTDNDRAGMLPFVFDDGMSFERYVDYALDVPMYFIMRDGQYINCAGESFRQFLDGKLPQRPGERPSVQDFEDHISTIFPEVRLKQFLEMRGADGGPWKEICALPAFWVGLMYEQSSLDAAWDLVKNWTDEERQTLRDDVPRLGMNAKIGGKSVHELAREVVKISSDGLKKRNILSWESLDERQYLDPLVKIVESGHTRSDILLQKYHGVWNEDIRRVYDEAMT